MDYKFSKAEVADFVRFWQSDAGKKYIKKMEETKKQLLEAAMGSADRGYICRSTAIANGFDSVLRDIDAIINNKEEEEKTAKKTS